jgi:hypothetical protein
LPTFLAAFRLVDIQNELREKNLHDTEEPPLTWGDVLDSLGLRRLRVSHRSTHCTPPTNSLVE